MSLGSHTSDALQVGTSCAPSSQGEQELRASEARFRFLYQVTEATKEVSDPEGIMAITARMLGEQLDASICSYADVEPDEDAFTVRGDWVASGALSSVGRYRLTSFGATAARSMRAGCPFVMNDILQDLGPEQGAAFLKLRIFATVCMPVVKRGALTAIMAVHSGQPRAWSANDVALVHEVTERSWAHIERVRAEAELRLGEQRFRGAVEAVQGTLWTTDAQGRMQGAQPAWTQLTGQTHEEYRDEGWSHALHPEDRQPTLDAWKRAVAAHRTFEFEHRVRRASDGEWRRFAVRAIPLVDGQGHIVEWVGVHTDVTEQRAAEQALREADRRKDEFIATLAHELRNPLAPIRNASQVARSSTATDAQRRWAHDVIERQARHMALLLDDLLDVSRITRGTLQLRSEPVELAAIVEAALETARPLIDAHGHEIAVDLPQDPVWLEGDELRLAQVLSNLLTNAAKYSDPHGRIHVTACIHGGELNLQVTDRGIGIEPQMLPRLFGMFAQGKPAIDRAEGGLGIGLALVKGLVSLHGGSVEATSEGLGKGSTFTVRLPLAGHAESSRWLSTPQHVDRSSACTRRVLVADDNRDSAESLAALLSLEGHEIRCAYDGHEALQIAADFRPDVVLLDIGMPHLNGYETARRMRAQAWGRRVTLVAITGWGQADDKRRASEAGFDHHLVKPIDSQDLFRLFRPGGASLA